MPKIPVLIILCFRPLSGNYISQSFNGVYYERGIHCFRPLSGNYISQCITITVKEILDNVSVPCRGTTFLNKSGEKSLKRLEQTVSVPCRGTTFLNLVLINRDQKGEHSFRPLSGNYISQYHPCNPATSLGSWSGLRGKNIFGKINKMHLLKSAANSVFKPCAAKSKQIFSFIKKYQFHIVPSYILFPDSGYISRYVVKPSFLYLYSAYDFVAHLFCQRYLLLFQYLLFRQT